ncbi:hypothetical protein ACJV45_03890 [Gardnerella sp. Marseille-Q9181]|uniref:hypothetical protein n=1 Tax=Gardnerella sp. Marseille-Q9181 TaxID=3383029 RepID=UPI003AF7BFF3
MMNKKAIAAFAAGATLLAGFAMATPAFAETAPKQETCTPADAAKLAELKSAVTKATRAVNEAQYKLDDDQPDFDKASKELTDAKVQEANVKSYTEAEKKATQEFTDYKTAHAGDTTSAAYQAAQLKETQAKEDTKKALKDAKEALKSANEFADLDAVTTFVGGKKTAFDNARTKHLDLQSALDEAKGKLDAAQKALDKAQCKGEKKDPENPPANPPAHTADPSKSAASAELMRTQVVLAEADATNKDAQEKFVKSKAGFEAAKTQMAAFDAQVKSAADREEALRVAGKTDTDAYKAAVIDLKAAQSKANAYRTHEYANAEKDFGEKSGKALLAAAAYNAALVNYRSAYNKAVEVEASAVKGFADPNTLNPVSTDFPAAPAAAKAEAKKVEAKAEAKAQAAAPAAAAGKAGAAAAKGELAKGGNGHKAGEKLGNAGVGVALTALAASMLAGMGAAVRKMRH